MLAASDIRALYGVIDSEREGRQPTLMQPTEETFDSEPYERVKPIHMGWRVLITLGAVFFGWCATGGIFWFEFSLSGILRRVGDPVVWFPLLGAVVFGLIAFSLTRRAYFDHPPLELKCEGCDYDLRASTGASCPECGRRINDNVRYIIAYRLSRSNAAKANENHPL